jgi:hypothetical protein
LLPKWSKFSRPNRISVGTAARATARGLSRVIADEFYPDVLSDYACVANWLDGFRNDFVGVNNPTDQDQVSNGCAVLFLNWLHWERNYPWSDICKAGAPTLAQTHRLLAQQTNIDPWGLFSDAMAQRYPPGQLSQVRFDNPFRPRPAGALSIGG